MINIVYRADSVGPVARRVAKQNEHIRVLHEDEVTPAHLIAPPAPPTTAPVDPLVSLWEDAQEGAEAFAAIPLTRTEFSQTAIRELIDDLQKVITAQRIPAPIAPPAAPRTPNVLIRWGSRYEGNADIVINSLEAINVARDKKESRRVLQGIAPQTWFREVDVRTPAVIRPRRHRGGERFFVCRTRDEVARAIRRCGPGWYGSELIEKSNEYRVFVLQGRVITVSERFPANPTDVAWNLNAGGRLINVRRNAWPVQACRVALEASRRVGLEWSAVDVAIKTDGTPIVFEVNTAPGLRNEYTIEQIAWAFASIPENTNLQPVAFTAQTTWRDLIHPSLRQVEDERAAA